MIKYREITDIPKRVFVVGDIHGCADETDVLCEYLKSSAKLTPEDLVVFIGDYVDRGPQSKQVIDRLLKFKAEFPSTLFLKGNHEDMLLAYLGHNGREGKAYLLNGGAETLNSYGAAKEGSNEAVRESFIQSMPPEHLSFFQGLESYIIMGDFVFAHAGLNPLRDLRAQIEADLFWIREEFISNIHFFKRTVVFGHTPYEDVMFHLPYKIGIDTGLVYGNSLTCIEVMNREIFQVPKGKVKVKVGKFPERKEFESQKLERKESENRKLEHKDAP